MAKQETELQEFKINYLSQADYDAAKEAGELNPNELYCTPDDEANPPSMISDAFDPDKTYAKGDYCIAYNKLWKCLVQCQGIYPSEGTYWTACTVCEELKSSKIKSAKFTATTSVNGNVSFGDKITAIDKKIVVSVVARNASSGAAYVAIPYRYATLASTTVDVQHGVHVISETTPVAVVANTSVTCVVYYFEI